jgi:hypothetical protein
MNDREELAMYRRTEFPNETELSWPVAAALRERPGNAGGEPPAKLGPDRRHTGLTPSEAPGD